MVNLNSNNFQIGKCCSNRLVLNIVEPIFKDSVGLWFLFWWYKFKGWFHWKVKIRAFKEQAKYYFNRKQNIFLALANANWFLLKFKMKTALQMGPVKNSLAYSSNKFPWSLVSTFEWIIFFVKSSEILAFRTRNISIETSSGKFFSTWPVRYTLQSTDEPRKWNTCNGKTHATNYSAG